MARGVIVASNRGSVTFVPNGDGTVTAKRGAGGLVTALSGALAAAGGRWIASALTEDDRRASEAGRFEVEVGGAAYRLRYLPFDPQTFDRYYNGWTNRVLWFLHHYLWDTPRTPQFGGETAEHWEAFVEVNRAFAAAMAEEGDALGGSPVYLVQDYHLSLVPAMLKQLRGDARIAHFSHIPFAGPSYLRILPERYRSALLAGLLGADVVRSPAPEWAERIPLSVRLRPCGPRHERVSANALRTSAGVRSPPKPSPGDGAAAVGGPSMPGSETSTPRRWLPTACTTPCW